MNVLVACEFSGTVRDAFARRGHDAWSCDLLPTESPGQHMQCDVRLVLDDGWDLMVAFPPCTHLCGSGDRWWPEKDQQQRDALELVRTLMAAPIPAWAIENPVGMIGTAIRPPDQIIQPWMFGHGEVKTTCLWLQGLPKLRPTNPVDGGEQRCWKEPPGEDRWKRRSLTYSGIAEAMADQWPTWPLLGTRQRELFR